jgi:DNA polymerase-4
MANRRPDIVHVDVDAFFASVEQLLDPRLRGRPVLVGRGVVASASYEAKSRGVRTAMSIRDARRICPDAILVPGRYENYADYAARVRRVLDDFTPAVETAALDDFYLDFAGTERLYPDLTATLRRIPERILEETGLGVSLGAGTTKLVAAVASRLHRPRGFLIVPPGIEEEFLAPLEIEKLHGIGHAHAATLRDRGIQTIGQLRRLPAEALVAAFGDVIGHQLYDRARGLDPRPVAEPAAPKSISRETTIEGGTIDLEFLDALLEYLAERVGSTLRAGGRAARTITLRLRYMDSYSAARSAPLAPPTNDDKSLLETARELLRALYTRRVAVRFVGIGVTNLAADRRQNDLFDSRSNRRWYLNQGVDGVRQRYGWNALFYGQGLELREHYATKAEGLVLSTPCLSR